MRLKQALRNWLYSDAEEVECVSASPVRNESFETCPTLNFRVFPAIGHHIIEFHNYDSKTDRTNSTRYVISHEEDFGASLSKITATELLKVSR